MQGRVGQGGAGDTCRAGWGRGPVQGVSVGGAGGPMQDVLVGGTGDPCRMC